ncbi:hypothetical protein V5799_023368 [Amblyomma americanum]|uniref:Uncharacterized protein n=1 Tax=Amblyomma americanum TaxID=6943 RepID=A0AAQ4FHS9_AMBAM
MGTSCTCLLVVCQGDGQLLYKKVPETVQHTRVLHLQGVPSDCVTKTFLLLYCHSSEMKSCLWLALLSLTAVAYGAVIAPPSAAEQPVLSEDAQADIIEKAGKTLETVGRILQGKDVETTKEEQQDIIEVFKAMTSGEEADSEEVSEYIWPIIARGVVQGGVAHGVHRWLDRRG